MVTPYFLYIHESNRFSISKTQETCDSGLSYTLLMFSRERRRTTFYSCEVFAFILECRAGIFSRKAWKHLFAHAAASVCNWARDSADNLVMSEYGTRSCCRNMLVKTVEVWFEIKASKTYNFFVTVHLASLKPFLKCLYLLLYKLLIMH